MASLTILCLLVGCSSGPVVREPAPAPAARSGTPASITPGSGHSPTVDVGHSADERLVAISSEPEGARILINNQPVGRAPLRLALKVTAQGFCADYVTVRARFVAEDSEHVSHTIDVQLTPLEKPPATLHFTPEGGQRRM